MLLLEVAFYRWTFPAAMLLHTPHLAEAAERSWWERWLCYILGHPWLGWSLWVPSSLPALPWLIEHQTSFTHTATAEESWLTASSGDLIWKKKSAEKLKSLISVQVSRKKRRKIRKILQIKGNELSTKPRCHVIDCTLGKRVWNRTFQQSSSKENHSTFRYMWEKSVWIMDFL